MILPNPTETPVICEPWQGEIALQVIQTSLNGVKVVADGLIPGEEVMLIYERDLRDWRRLKGKVEVGSLTVGLDGRIEDEGWVLYPLSDGSPNRWIIKLVSASTVACAEIELPEEGQD